ncbi:MAG: hypothetical protein M0Z42_08240 [Actinomycetota bacterium]|jgi:PBP1b-binding outer membrane lipoprotein LpoB|nr:hypothetical protein [Actinomycetota bacterium]
MPSRLVEHAHRIGRRAAAVGLVVATALLLGACSAPWTAPASSQPTPTTTTQSLTTVPGVSGLSGAVTNSGAFNPSASRRHTGGTSGS